MDPEVQKLVAALTNLVSVLGENTGVPEPPPLPGSIGDDRYTPDKTRVASGRGLLVRFDEPKESDRTWTKISKIFATNFAEILSGPDYDEEKGDVSPSIVPAGVSRSIRDDREDKKGFLERVANLLAPIFTLAGGIALAVAAFMEGPGPLGNTFALISKGLSKISEYFIKNISEKLINISDSFLGGVSKIIDKGLNILGPGGKLRRLLSTIGGKIGGILLKGAKFLPFIGSAVAFYFAYKRFQQGDLIGASMEIASGLLNLIPGVGWIASAIVDVASIVRDIKTTPEERVASSKKIIPNLLSGIKEWFAKNGMKAIKSLPFIGSLVYFWEAYQAGFTTESGIKKVIAAFAGTLGAGPVIESAINLLFSLFDESEDEPQTKTAQKPTGKSFFRAAKDFVLKSIEKLPLWLRKPLEWMGIGSVPESEYTDQLDSNINRAKEYGSELWEKTKAFGANVKDWFVSNAPKAKEISIDIWRRMKDLNSNVQCWFVDNLPKAKELGINIWEKTKVFGAGIKDWFVDGMPKAKELGKDIWEKMSSAAKITIETIDNMIDKAGEIVKKGLELLGNMLAPIFDKIKEFTSNAIDWAKGIFNFDDQSEQLGSKKSTEIKITIKEGSINIKSEAIDIIARNSAIQINLLQTIADKISQPQIQQPQQPASPPTVPLVSSSSGSFSRDMKGNSLLPFETIGSVV